KATEPLKTFYLEGGFVEQDPEDIYQNVLASLKSCIEIFKGKGGDVKSILTTGISNQRETFIIWDKDGKALYNAVVWQCKRSIDICKRLRKGNFSQLIRTKTGLLIDPYFSGTK